MRRRRSPARDLRLAVECLPEHTRAAMLEGIREGGIIVGAYTDGRGGTCPMLAAHRRGGRTSFATFAKAWDRYTRAESGPRPATERELRTLEAMLVGSLGGAGSGGAGAGSLADAVDEVKAARRTGFEREAAESSSGYIRSPGLTNWISGTRQAGEVLSRKRTASAMS